MAALPILLLNSAMEPLLACVVKEGAACHIQRASAESRFSQEGVTLIAAALDNEGLKPSEAEVMACVVGPGSFTGIRTGLALLKGLAFGRPVRGIALSTLHAIAYEFLGRGMPVCTVLDARMNQWYTAVYASDGTVIQPEKAQTPEDFIAGLHGDILVACTGAETFKRFFENRENVRARFVEPSEKGMLKGLTETARWKLLQGETMPMSAMEPLYLRKTYAEIKVEVSR